MSFYRNDTARCAWDYLLALPPHTTGILHRRSQLSAFSDGRVLAPLDEARARAAYRNSGVEVLKLAAVGSDSCYILGVFGDGGVR